MLKETDILIIGGGLAGLTAGIDLARKGYEITIVEKDGYPRHKVCGEYVSNEVLPYLFQLGVSPMEAGAKEIKRFQFSSNKGKSLEAKLPLGGFGISRYALDMLLYEQALKVGVKFVFDKVEKVAFSEDQFNIQTKQGVSKAKIVLGAFGKRSNLDRSLTRSFIGKKSPWLAIKAHYKADFSPDLVALHNFKGGYCGLSQVETGAVNVCYLAAYKDFREFKGITAFQEEVLFRNSKLKAFFEEAEMLWKKPLSISQISFAPKLAVEGHVLMIGDTAGLINPLCGNGMAIAIHSAKLAANLVNSYFLKKIDRRQLEQHYKKQWEQEFLNRMRNGRRLARLFRNPAFAQPVQGVLRSFPGLLPKIIKCTHGNPIL